MAIKIHNASEVYAALKVIIPSLPDEAVSLTMQLNLNEAPTVTVTTFINIAENNDTETKQFKLVGMDEQ